MVRGVACTSLRTGAAPIYAPCSEATPTRIPIYSFLGVPGSSSCSCTSKRTTFLSLFGRRARECSRAWARGWLAPLKARAVGLRRTALGERAWAWGRVLRVRASLAYAGRWAAERRGLGCTYATPGACTALRQSARAYHHRARALAGVLRQTFYARALPRFVIALLPSVVGQPVGCKIFLVRSIFAPPLRASILTRVFIFYPVF